MYPNKMAYCAEKGYAFFDANILPWINKVIKNERLLLPVNYFYKYRAMLELKKSCPNSPRQHALCKNGFRFVSKGANTGWTTKVPS